MALTPRLEFRQTQNLSLTPQLMQSIRLLQLNFLELEAFVAQEMERNPLLESEDGASSDEGSEEPGPEPLAEGYEISSQLGSAVSIADNLDTDVANVFPEQVGQDSYSQSTQLQRRGESVIGAAESADLDTYVASVPSLSEQLAQQAGSMLSGPIDRLIARHLIDNLSEAGYLQVSVEEISAQLGTDGARVEAVLGIMRSCDPPGIFARDLKECLSIQLSARDRLDPMMAKLLDNLELVAAHDIPQLCRLVGGDRDDVMDMLAELKMLDPRPGRAFDLAPVQSIVPDAYVRRGTGVVDLDGEKKSWVVELNTEILPRVLVNRTYYSMVVRRSRDVAEKKFMTDCLQTANWLTKSLDQRAQTILKVATEIVRQQDGFLEHGVEALKPMTLKTVAEAIGAHESTVSRVTSNKYLATPRGLFEMKYFFTTAIGATDGGDEHSAESVRHQIRHLIDAETAASILSDDIIADILKRQQGIDLARRTVAKYREAMNIPSSVVRRRQKKSLAPAH